MQRDAVTVRADAPATADLVRAGWTAVASSWAAELRVPVADEAAVVARLERLVARVSPLARIRELTPADADAALALDRATLADYPGGPATRHDPLTPTTARPAAGRRAWGAFPTDAATAAAPSLLAMTFTVEPAAARASVSPVDPEPVDPGVEAVETDFTVVARGWRGRGLGSAVKAASVLALLADGHRRFRTGGATENTASLAAAHTLGYTIDERWLTLEPPA
ncbi:acetyltransferase [Herbiconiux sp. VKM Ac-2851]|nr:acetyltransferase [Herbiconiux sp. VKM Ac-2851]